MFVYALRVFVDLRFINAIYYYYYYVTFGTTRWEPDLNVDIFGNVCIIFCIELLYNMRIITILALTHLSLSLNTFISIFIFHLSFYFYLYLYVF